MSTAAKLAFCLFLTMLAGNSLANVGSFREGLAALKRHDYAAAAALLQWPAEQGNPRAQSLLCFMYSYGRGVPQDYFEAVRWCVRAANQGNSEAQYMLALMYNKGHGVPEDFVLAHKWLNLAAARASGSKRDFFYSLRNAVATKMSPAQITIAQTLATQWRPVPELQRSASITAMCNRAKQQSQCPDRRIVAPGHFAPAD